MVYSKHVCPELKTKTTNEGMLFDIFALKIHKNAAFVPLQHKSDGSCGSGENQNVNSEVLDNEDHRHKPTNFYLKRSLVTCAFGSWQLNTG